MTLYNANNGLEDSLAICDIRESNMSALPVAHGLPSYTIQQIRFSQVTQL